MPTLEEILHAKQERIDQQHRLQPGRTALLVVDMQRGFLEPGAALEVPAGREIIPNLRRLIDVCREHRVPVIFTEYIWRRKFARLRTTSEVITEIKTLR